MPSLRACGAACSLDAGLELVGVASGSLERGILQQFMCQGRLHMKHNMNMCYFLNGGLILSLL